MMTVPTFRTRPLSMIKSTLLSLRRLSSLTPQLHNSIHTLTLSSTSSCLLEDSRLSRRRLLRPTSIQARFLHTADTSVVSGWKLVNIPDPVITKIAETYPHALEPTPAQRTLLLALHKGLDIFLKDEMGKGKTLAIALAALSLVYPPLKKSDKGQILILVPTLPLQNQVQRYLSDFQPCSSTALVEVILHKTRCSSPPNFEAPILLSTPQSLISHCPEALSPTSSQQPFLPRLSHIILDEPDTMLSPIPPVNKRSNNHPFYVHPPLVVPLLYHILGIRSRRAAHGRRVPGANSLPLLDYSERRNDISTCWIGSGVNNVLRQLVRNNGWVRAQGEQGKMERTLITLDYTETASIEQKRIIKRFDDLYIALSGESRKSLKDNETKKTSHLTFVVDPRSGEFVELNPLVPPVVTQPSLEKEKNGFPPELVEALALLHAVNPPPPGTYSLALPPEGSSLDRLVKDLTEMDLDAQVLLPSQLSSNSLTDLTNPPEKSTILVTSRSTIPGLHLPHLHTVYLLSGLDVGSLSPGQRKRGGMEGIKGRAAFYDVIVGRLARMGMKSINDERRIVSLVMKGSEEEAVMWNMFHGTLRHGSRASEEKS